MISESKVIEIYCKIDDFMKDYDATIANYGIKSLNSIKKRNRKFIMSDSKVMSILVLFHLIEVSS